MLQQECACKTNDHERENFGNNHPPLNYSSLPINPINHHPTHNQVPLPLPSHLYRNTLLPFISFLSFSLTSPPSPILCFSIPSAESNSSTNDNLT